MENSTNVEIHSPIIESCEWLPLSHIRQYAGYTRAFYDIDGDRYTFKTIDIACTGYSVDVICEMFTEAVKDTFACAFQMDDAFICWRYRPTLQVDVNNVANLRARLLVSSNRKLLKESKLQEHANPWTPEPIGPLPSP